jgi:hypothetical protein
VARDPERARALIGETVADGVGLFQELLAEARHELGLR